VRGCRGAGVEGGWGERGKSGDGGEGLELAQIGGEAE